jgi:Stress responsive A/B Barrel Domain
MTLQHIVLFSFPRELTEDEAGQMRGMVASWPGEIGLMTKCRFGTDLTGARTRGYDYLLYTEFPDVAALGLAVLAWLRARRPDSVAMIGSILGEEGGTDAAVLDR